ncbi:MAG: hypothetical protein K2I95_02915 [Treponemataceae bacterium]|nr:hypothetical protein [Treponemataceae bacterium]
MAQRKISVAGKNFVERNAENPAAMIGVPAAGSLSEGTKCLRKDEPRVGAQSRRKNETADSLPAAYGGHVQIIV